MRRLFYSVSFLFLFISFYSQAPLIHVKKDRPFLFFQKGPKSDSIVRHKSDVFYLLAPDSLKQDLTVFTENGRLLPTANDSLFRFEYLEGLRYETFYTFDEKGKAEPPSVLISGPVTGGQVRIRLVNRKTNRTLLENSFVYVP